MGLNNRESNLTYIRIKDGKIVSGKKGEEQSYDEVSGTITKMYYKNEMYENQEQRKLVLVISDGGENYCLSINTDNSNYSTLISFLKDANLKQPLTLHPKMEVISKDGVDVKRHTVLVSQNGKFSKSYFTKENAQKIGLPAWDVVVVGKKKVTDKTNYLEFLEKFVETNYISQIEQGGNTFTSLAVKQTKADILDDEAEVVTTEALPWD